MMTARLAFAAATLLVATPAMAGILVPDPEAGVGMVGMGLAAGLYVMLRKRFQRK